MKRPFALALLLTAACAPRARPLGGAPAPAAVRLPQIALPDVRERIVFRWRYAEPGFSARGDGVARIAPPDSARLDFFLDGGFGSGWAALVGTQLRTPDDNAARRLVPQPPLLWATLGRLTIPATPDTNLRVSADTLRADLTAGAAAYRVTVVGPILRRLERLQSGRVVEAVVRGDSTVVYQDFVARRTLSIDLQRRERTAPFPDTLWQP